MPRGDFSYRYDPNFVPQTLRDRADKLAHKAYKRDFRRNRRDRKRLGREYRQERARLEGATAAAVGALGGYDIDSNLTGRHARQAQRAISGLSQDYQTGLEQQLPQLREGFVDARQGLKQARSDLKFDRTQAAQDTLAELIERRAERMQTRAERDRTQARLQTGTQRATQVAQEIIESFPDDAPPLAEFTFGDMAQLRDDIAKLGGFDRRRREDQAAIERALRALVRGESKPASSEDVENTLAPGLLGYFQGLVGGR